MPAYILLTILAFVLLWVGAGVAVKAISTISHSLKLSSFTVSFFVLGLFTSITEILVGTSALLENTPEIYVGNLIGSSAVVFLIVLPLLAIAGNGFKIIKNLNIKDLASTCLIAFIPAALTLDNSFSVLDGFISFLAYLIGAHIVSTRSNLFDKVLHQKVPFKTLITNILLVLLSLLIVFVGSYLLVKQIPELGKVFHISPFVVSLLLVSIGTNVPELSIAIRTIFNKHKEIALGTYLGSALVNTLEIGVLTIIRGGSVNAEGSNFSVLLFGLGVLLFIFFVRSKHELSRAEGIMLFCIYILEIFTGPGWNLQIVK